NALNAQLVGEIRTCFDEFARDENIKGVILTGLPGVFSAGLDLPELYEYNEEEIREFLIAFGSMHIELVRFPKPFICAINGHSPAGGTVIAVAADDRFMVNGEKYTIGLNELAVNVQITSNLIYAYDFWLGQKASYKAIMAGKLFKAEEAYEAGLVDALTNEDNLLAKAENRMKQYMMVNQEIFLNTKAKLRKEWLSILDDEANDLEQVLKVWWSPEVRERMGMFIAMLKSR
ncbi:MAG: enoyl-CoA hydratase/isomerase family protein, partial [Bacteroidia bacterium]|nr:enoyl-CoA hydratase/isomerase family protein [Bacteroidia bacterium]